MAIKEIKFYDAFFESRELNIENKDPGYFAGIASTEDLDGHGTIIEKGAFSESIEKRGFKGAKGIKLLLNHNREKIAGVISNIEYRDEGLFIEGQMNLDIQAVREFYSSVKMLNGIGLSVGFRNYILDERDGNYYITKADLVEVSMTGFPSNEESEITSLRHQGEKAENSQEIEKLEIEKIKAEIILRDIQEIRSYLKEDLQKWETEAGESLKRALSSIVSIRKAQE